MNLKLAWNISVSGECTCCHEAALQDWVWGTHADDRWWQAPTRVVNTSVTPSSELSGFASIQHLHAHRKTHLGQRKRRKKTHAGIFSVSACFWQMISDIYIVKVWELPLKELLLFLGVHWSNEHLSRIKQLLLIH